MREILSFISQRTYIIIIKKKARMIFMPYEIFMDITDYEGKYQVSNLGRVRNNKGEILKQNKRKDGYMQIGLYNDNGKRKFHFVHRLVLSTFKANPDNKPQVNHINEDKTDNRLNNLEWATPKENNEHGTRTERVSNANKIKVKCIELDEVFDSAKDAALWLNKEHGTHITACCKRKSKSAYGYTWKYVNPKEQITVTNKPVFNITTNTKYANAVEASKAYGQVKTDYIYKACRYGNTCGNCQWCFYEEDMENWEPDAFMFIWD